MAKNKSYKGYLSSFILMVVLLLTGCVAHSEPLTLSPVKELSPTELWDGWALENRPDTPMVVEVEKVPEIVGARFDLELLINSNASKTYHQVCLSKEGQRFECSEEVAGSAISKSLNLEDGNYMIEVHVTAVNFPPSGVSYSDMGGVESNSVWSHQFTVDTTPAVFESDPIVFSRIDEIQIGGLVRDSGISTVSVAEAPNITSTSNADGSFALYIPRSEVGNVSMLTLQLFDSAGNKTQVSVPIPPPASSWVGRSADVEDNKIKFIFPAENWHPNNISDAGIHFIVGWGNIYFQRYDANSNPVERVFEPTWWVVLRWTVLAVVVVVFLFLPDILFKKSIFKAFKPSVDKVNNALSSFADVLNKEAEVRKQGLVSREDLRKSVEFLDRQNKSQREKEEIMQAALELLAQHRPNEAEVLLKLLTDPRGQALIQKRIQEKRELSLERRNHGRK